MNKKDIYFEFNNKKQFDFLFGFCKTSESKKKQFKLFFVVVT